MKNLNHLLSKFNFNSRRFWLPVLFLTWLIISGQGCALTLKTQPPVNNLGVWKSTDKGLNWEQKVFVSSGKAGVVTIGNINVDDLVFGPEDSRVIYLASENQGLWATETGGDNWVNILPAGKIVALAIDQQNPATLFVSRGNFLYKTQDYGRRWKQILIEPRAGVIYHSIIIRRTNPRKIITANNQGEIIQSLDEGESWTKLYEFGQPLTKIKQSPLASDLLYGFTLGKSLWKSEDGGTSWQELTAGLKNFPRVLEIKDIVFDPFLLNRIYLVSFYGILRSDDNGANWQPLKLLTPPATVNITALNINPKNNQEIFYVTSDNPHVLYRTFNSGRDWETLGLPSDQIPTALLIDFQLPDIMYLGFKGIPKK